MEESLIGQKLLGNDGPDHTDLEDPPPLLNIYDLSRTILHAKRVWGKTSRMSSLHLGENEIRTRARWRKRLGTALESTRVHGFLVLLLLMDLVATSVGLVTTLRNYSHDLAKCVPLVESCHCTRKFETTEPSEALRLLSICALSVLLIHVLGLLLAFGFSFFRHGGYVLDLVVLTAALALEIFENEVAGLLIILNLWRIIVVAHGVMEVSEEARKTEMLPLDKQLKGLEASYKRDQDLICEMKRQIKELEKKLQEKHLIMEFKEK